MPECVPEDAHALDRVRSEIESAFAGLRAPRAWKLIRHRGGRDRAGEESIRRALAGKPWQSLDRDFLEHCWSSFCYLGPEAYRYYLPGLLTAALDAFIGRGSLLHSTLFSLRPSFWSLYYRGGDQDFADRQAAFSPAQYRAVCAFLGLAFEHAPTHRHLAAQGLRFGWNRLHTPALEAAEEFYRRLHTHTYPEPTDPEIAALFAEIRTAFAETPYPGDDRLCGSEQGDEPAEYAMELRGLRWQSIHPELLEYNYAALSFLTAEGFRYFLPAFLLADLAGYESNGDPVFHLTYGSDTGDTFSLTRLAGFSRPERLAIIRYLELRARREFSGGKVHRSLEGYWRPSLG